MEIWKAVVGYEGMYEVSDLGRVRNRRGRILRLHENTHGYLSVGIYSLGGSARRTRMIHTLVLEAFVGPRPDNMEACHGTGGRHDNSLGNLRWGTKVENMADKHRDGTMPFGEINGNARLTTKEVLEIRNLAGEGRSFRSLAQQYEVTKRTISLVVRRKTWTHTA